MWIEESSLCKPFVCYWLKKSKYPENFFLLRGSHECASINHITGSMMNANKGLISHRGRPAPTVPLSAYSCHCSEEVCCHGGLSANLQSRKQSWRVVRPTDVPHTRLLCDMLWSDPEKDVQGWGENNWVFPSRLELNGYDLFAK